VKAKNEVKESLFSSDSFSNLNLAPHITDTLTKRFDLSTMTQIQEKSIPAIMDGKDCFVKSQTGSGKTLAYAIPVVQRLQERLPRIKRTDGIFALVLVPTREVTPIFILKLCCIPKS
jgi:ATP-dependent RNA helicase DDX31/DBP7